MIYGQLLMGAPGAGKTTYCKAMDDLLTQMGRKVCRINLDPAIIEEDDYSDDDIDVRELISLKDVAEYEHLGPNGGILFAFEFLEKNVHWLLNKIQESGANYFLIDCPGQVELFTHHESLANIIGQLKIRLCGVYLVDFNLVADDYGRLVQATLLALSSMLRLQLPHINVFTKIDLVLGRGYGSWEDVMDECRENGRNKQSETKYAKLNDTIDILVEDYGLVGFLGMSVHDMETLAQVITFVDKATNFVLTTQRIP